MTITLQGGDKGPACAGYFRGWKVSPVVGPQKREVPILLASISSPPPVGHTPDQEGADSPVNGSRFQLAVDLDRKQAGPSRSSHSPQPDSFDRQTIREAVLLSFVDPLPSQCLRLERLSLQGWTELLRWLDYSGLALYFFDRVEELKLDWILPESVRTRLRQNLEDNTVRTRGMIEESIAIQQEFQDGYIHYANLKGFSLSPRSVPRPELRSQFDLDFLVSEHDAARARAILEKRGYRLYATSRRSWEFKRNERPGFSLKDLYKDLQSWRVELHIEAKNVLVPSPLDQREWRELAGFRMPVLSPIDEFVGQGLHACKHLCGEFTRAAHLLEFRRHVLSRYQEDRFWNELYRVSQSKMRVRPGLGLVTLLTTEVMGQFAPTALSEWTVSCLSRDVRLWVRLYARRAVLGSFPGSKLYLLLQSALVDAGLPAKADPRQSLIPSSLPPPVIRKIPRESPSIRLARYRMQCGFILSRLRFHVVEGLRYVVELQRWHRLTNQSVR